MVQAKLPKAFKALLVRTDKEDNLTIGEKVKAELQFESEEVVQLGEHLFY